MTRASCNGEDPGLPAQTRGDTWLVDIELTDGDQPADLTGASIWVTLKTDLAQGDAQAALNFEFVVPAGEDAQNGVATMEVPSNQTANVPAGKYQLGLRRVYPGTPDNIWTFYRQRNFEVLEAIGGVA